MSKEENDSEDHKDHKTCSPDCKHDHHHEHDEALNVENTFKLLIAECEKKLQSQEEKRKKELSEMQYCFKEDTKKIHEDYHKKTTHIFKTIIRNIVDPIDRAQLHVNSDEKSGQGHSSITKGLKLIHDSIHKTLKLLHIHRVDAADVAMDENIHEASEMIDTDDEKKHHTIAVIMTPGYYYQSAAHAPQDVLQPAVVKVYEYIEKQDN